MSNIGFGLTREDVMSLAFAIVEKTGRPHPFHDGAAGRSWYDGFMRRHPKAQKKREEVQKKRDEAQKRREEAQRKKEGASKKKTVIKKTKKTAKKSSEDECPKYGKSYDSGDLWICCDSCERWLDIKCAGLEEKIIPELFYCENCN